MCWSMLAMANTDRFTRDDRLRIAEGAAEGEGDLALPLQANAPLLERGGQRQAAPEPAEQRLAGEVQRRVGRPGRPAGDLDPRAAGGDRDGSAGGTRRLAAHRALQAGQQVALGLAMG